MYKGNKRRADAWLDCPLVVIVRTTSQCHVLQRHFFTACIWLSCYYRLDNYMNEGDTKFSWGSLWCCVPETARYKGGATQTFWFSHQRLRHGHFTVDRSTRCRCPWQPCISHDNEKPSNPSILTGSVPHKRQQLVWTHLSMNDWVSFEDRIYPHLWWFTYSSYFISRLSLL